MLHLIFFVACVAGNLSAGYDQDTSETMTPSIEFHVTLLRMPCLASLAAHPLPLRPMNNQMRMVRIARDTIKHEAESKARLR